MSEWRGVKVEDVCEKITDGAHNSPKSVSFGMPMASVKDLTFWGINLTSSRHISKSDYEKLVKQGCRPEPDDILIAKDGNSALDTVCRLKTPIDAVLLSSVAILRPDKTKIVPDFLKFYFRAPNIISYLKSNFISGAAIPRVVLKDFKRAKILLPPIDEQKEISNVLASLDDKIELNQRVNETLEGMARAIFKSWFVDFDPVHAKAEGRDPEGMDAQTAALFPPTFTPDGLPEGWGEKPISEIGNVITGKTPSTKDEENYGDQTPFITIPDMHGKIYVLTCGKYLSSKGVSTQKNKTLPAGSICVSCIATPGLTILTHEECQTNQQINAVVPFKKEVQNFRFWQIKEVSEEVVSKGSGGSVFHNLNKSQFSDLKVIEPSFELIKAYEEIVSSFMEKILENEKQNQTLAALRDTLLPKLISGELRVTTTDTLKEAV